MTQSFRYGVFQVGQIWCVVCDGQPELGFPNRDRALAAVDVLRKTHHMAGDACEVFMLDGSSRLVEMPEAGA
jgi:hypothetical protein